MPTPQRPTELTIDLAIDGFQVGVFCVHHPIWSHPDRVHQTPLCVFRQHDGPVVCLISGVGHGDVAGTTVLQHLVQNIELEHIAGTLIVCPSFTNGSSSVAGNGLVTGSAEGFNNGFANWDATEQAALRQTFAEALLDTADVIIELASGTKNTVHTPHISHWPSLDEATNDWAESLMFAVGAPDSVRRFDAPLPHSLAHYATTSNTTYLKIELGHFNTTDKHSRLMGAAQCQNALLHTGVLKEGFFQLNSTRILETGKPEYCIRTPVAGLVHWHVEPGGNVYLGNPIASVYDPHNPFAKPTHIDANMNGVLLTRFSGACCHPGNLLAVVADEVPR